jgi:hypothetical protein
LVGQLIFFIGPKLAFFSSLSSVITIIIVYACFVLSRKVPINWSISLFFFLFFSTV